MKRFQILVIIISLLVLITMLASCAKSKGLFLDNNLEEAVRDSLNLLLGEEITPSNVVAITKLTAGDSNITDLPGIEYCINLNELDLPNNVISDIYPLYSLSNLINLNLENNQINQIPAPCTFYLLITLNLNENQIDDISPLAPLSNMAILSISDNQITDISPLASLSNLTRLNLNGNKITDISPLVENEGLGEGDRVLLKDNGLDLVEGSEDMMNIRALEDRGVQVIY
jgi:Leucine-rich repeat (LRR) protein